MTKQRNDELYSNLGIALIRKLQNVPFHYYKTCQGPDECGHLLNPGVYQQLLMWMEHTPASRFQAREQQDTSARTATIHEFVKR